MISRICSFSFPSHKSLAVCKPIRSFLLRLICDDRQPEVRQAFQLHPPYRAVPMSAEDRTAAPPIPAGSGMRTSLILRIFVLQRIVLQLISRDRGYFDTRMKDSNCSQNASGWSVKNSAWFWPLSSTKTVSGKTFFIYAISRLRAVRSASPYQYWTGHGG